MSKPRISLVPKSIIWQCKDKRSTNYAGTPTEAYIFWYRSVYKSWIRV